MLCRHTHEKVDQVFSVISRYLNTYDTLTVSSLLEGVKKAFTKPVPNVEELPFVFDMQPYLDDLLPPAGDINNMSKPHQFRIRAEPNAVGEVKSNVACRRWHDSQESAPCHLLQRLPDSPPQLKAGRPVFFRHDSPSSTECDKRFDAFLSHLTQVCDL